MKITDVVLHEDHLPGETISANLVPVLLFLKKRSESKGISPKLKTDSLIQLVRNAGDRSFAYDHLVKAHETDPAVKELIKSFSKDEVILTSTAEDSESGSNEEQKADSEEVVDQMAKKALKQTQ